MNSIGYDKNIFTNFFPLALLYAIPHCLEFPLTLYLSFLSNNRIVILKLIYICFRRASERVIFREKAGG